MLFRSRRRVTDAAVQRVGTILGEPDDVRRRLAAGQLAEQAGDRGSDDYDSKPSHQSPIEAMLEQVERERAGRNEKHEDPDWPVVESVVELVPSPNLPLRVELDAPRVGGDLYVHGRVFARI